MACLGVGDMIAARAHLEEAVSLARKLGNTRELTAALNALGMLHRLEGRLGEAAPICEQVLALTRELGDQEYIAIALLNLAMVCVGSNAGDRARSMLLEVMKIGEEIGSKPVSRSALEVCAALAAAHEHWLQAAQLFGVAEAQKNKPHCGAILQTKRFWTHLWSEQGKLWVTQSLPRRKRRAEPCRLMRH